MKHALYNLLVGGCALFVVWFLVRLIIHYTAEGYCRAVDAISLWWLLRKK